MCIGFLHCCISGRLRNRLLRVIPRAPRGMCPLAPFAGRIRPDAGKKVVMRPALTLDRYNTFGPLLHPFRPSAAD